VDSSGSKLQRQKILNFWQKKVGKLSSRIRNEFYLLEDMLLPIQGFKIFDYKIALGGYSTTILNGKEAN
jgi:hypothetical protein